LGGPPLSFSPKGRREFSSAATSPMTNSAGPSSSAASTPSALSVVKTRRSVSRLAFSTTTTGVDPARPAAIRRAAIFGAVDRPI